MQGYHLRRSDKELNDLREIEDVLGKVRIMTVACSLGDEPYLFTVDFAWDPKARELWFHCAAEGRKMTVLEANPRVCVSVVEDRGYMEGECDHAYRSLIMEGEARVISDLAEKRRGLGLLARKHEPDPAAIMARFAGNDEAVRKVGIMRISVRSISAKQGPATKG